jgi:nitroreductase
MDALEAILTRRSVAALAEPAPDGAALARILDPAAAPPDHGRMRPWRIVHKRRPPPAAVRYELAAALRHRHPEASESECERERRKPERAPLILVVAASPRERRGVPATEQTLAAGAAAQNALLAAHALGYGAIWRSGDPAFDPMVKAALGLQADDSIVGFLYIGTPQAEASALPDRPPAEFVEWHGANGEPNR